MFTGLIQAVGRVISAESSAAGVRFGIDPCGWDCQPQSGDSIAVDGCCLTVAAMDAMPVRWWFDVVSETLQKTTLGTLKPGPGGSRVNLEASCRADTLLGGHIVQGHIEGVARVTAVRDDPSDWRVTLRPPVELMDAIVPKGSIAVSGVSLTIARAGREEFEVALIPTTLAKTNLGDLRTGSACNIETDCIARTVVHWLRRQRGEA